MTVSLTNVAIQQFEDQFIIEYQGRRTLEEGVQVRRGVIGDAYKWPRIGPAVMELRGAPQSIIPASDVTHTQVTTSFEDRILNTPTDIFQQAQVNASERQALAFDHAMAVGRRTDQIIINALAASGTTNTIVNGGTNMSVAKLRQASFLLNEDNVDPMNRFIAMHPSQLKALLAETETTSSDFNTVKALVSGEIDSFMGFKFFLIAERTEGGLPKTGDIRTAFAWQQRAMGMAFAGFEGGQANPSVTVDWDPLRQSWLTISKLRAGASALQPVGIVDIDCDETA
jgi:hypothetical protein